ncbi:MAG TPA: efflux RND transporter periplasmic adaptor subunit [Chitinivibrionales bacterium]|jgi:membrane fusion protein (multidrug efflux system)|nr:efflux RND transporter periplasmic adaptor subunit [Chitinivibrionales bacterium]
MITRKLKILVASAAGALCIIACVATTGCNGKDTTKQGAAARHPGDSAVVKVVVADVNEGPFEDWGSYSADLRGIEDANLVAPVQGGRVNSLKPVGTYFKEGDALCDIEGDKYGAALEAARAQVAVAKGDLDRATANVQNGSLGRSAVDAANLAYQNARMLLATAKRSWEDCQCQAPFDGILVSRNIERFQTVAPGATTVRVSRIDKLEAIIAIPESEAFSYEEGMKTEFRLLQRPEKSYEGMLRSLDRAVDAKSRTVMARIVVTNRDGTLKPGMVGRASILRHKYAKAVVVPSAALLRLQDGICAMVVENGIARQRKVLVEATNTDSSLIKDGLHQGDKLVVTGAFQVSDGTKVLF